jgi:AcrR family transcriptional regulator
MSKVKIRKPDDKKSNKGSDYHHGDLHDALVKTALELIKEKGVSGLSLREVARRAGVSHGAPAHHFKDKSGLITAIATQGFLVLNEQVKGLSTSGNDLIMNFRQAGMAYVRFAANNPAYFEVMFQPALHQKDNQALLTASLQAYSQLREAAEKIHTQFNSKIDPEALALRAWSTAHGLSQLWLSGNLSPSFDIEVLERSLEAVFKGGETAYITQK